DAGRRPTAALPRPAGAGRRDGVLRRHPAATDGAVDAGASAHRGRHAARLGLARTLTAAQAAGPAVAARAGGGSRRRVAATAEVAAAWDRESDGSGAPGAAMATRPATATVLGAVADAAGTALTAF